jgi:long-chain acyl-CoA synthetase
MRFEWKHSIVEEAKGELSATVAGAPLGYFDQRYKELVGQGFTSVLSLIVKASEKTPDAIAVKTKRPGGYEQLTFQELVKTARRLAQGLIEGSYCAESVYEGKKMRMIGIFLNDNFELLVADLAAQFVPAVTIFLHTKQETILRMELSSFPFESIITNARNCEILTSLMEDKKCRIYSRLVLTEDISAALKERLTRLGVKAVLMSALQANNGEAVPLPQVQPEDPLTLLPTSGSTGEPKFILVPNRVVLDMVAYGFGGSLPPGAPFFLTVHYYGGGIRLTTFCFLAYGTPVVTFKGSAEDTSVCIRETNPAVVFWAPDLLLGVYEYACKAISQRPLPDAEKLRVAIETKITFIKETKQLHHEAIDAQLQELRSQLFGTRLQVIYWGGITLHENLQWFLHAVSSVPLIGNYGQAEICGTVAMQEAFNDTTIIGHITPPYQLKLLSRPDLGFTIEDVVDGKKCPRGELLVKGPVRLSYYNADADFKKLLYDGEWIRTNDLMQLDLENLSFRIIDRANNIRHGLHGHSIPVAKHERVYEASAYVHQLCVYVKETSPYVYVIIVPNEEPLRKLATSKGIQGDLSELCRNEAIRKDILTDLRAVATAAKIVAGDQVMDIVLSATPFMIENGLLTETHKIRRDCIYSFFEPQLQAVRKLYESQIMT